MYGLAYFIKQWRIIGLEENYDGVLRTINVTTPISFKEISLFSMAVPSNRSEANLITVVDSTLMELNNTNVYIKGTVTRGSNGQVRVVFIGK